MAKRNRVITFVPIIALVTLLAVSLQFNGLPMMWKIPQAKQTTPIGLPCCGNEIIRCVMKLRCFVIDHLTRALLRRIHPAKISSPFTEIRIGKTEISVTEPGHPLIWTHQKSTGLIWRDPKFARPHWISCQKSIPFVCVQISVKSESV